MKFQKRLQFALVFIVIHVEAAPPTHVWETEELTFTAKNSYKNAYTDVASGIFFKKYFVLQSAFSIFAF